MYPRNDPHLKGEVVIGRPISEMDPRSRSWRAYCVRMWEIVMSVTTLGQYEEAEFIDAIRSTKA